MIAARAPRVWNRRVPNVPAYRRWIFRDLHEQRMLRAAIRAELRGKDLVCWCAPLACHGDTLPVIANTEEGDAECK